jgi:Holliday junction DNA helicase RuvB
MVDPIGLDSEDKKYLNTIRNLFEGGPVGIETLAASLSETSNTLEDVIEPYLLQQGLIQKTSRGRILTTRGFSFAD